MPVATSITTPACRRAGVVTKITDSYCEKNSYLLKRIKKDEKNNIIPTTVLINS